MACKASKVPLFRLVATRGYAAQAATKTGSKGEVQSCVLPNKLVVATAESSLPISRVSILFRAGSRNETYENLGASHMMRIAGGLSTKRSSNFAICRNIQQAGGSLSVSSDRETVAYNLEITSDKLEEGLNYLQDVATQPCFKPWEIVDSIPRLRNDLAAVPDQVCAVELLHKAAYRTGLGNSIFCPEHQVGRLSSEAMQHFFNANYTTNRCAVVGVGVDQRLLSGYAQDFVLESGDGKAVPSKYYGGELRCDKPGNVAHVAIAGNGSTLADLKEAVTFAVLQQAAGTGASCKRGNVNGAFGKAISSAVGTTPFNVSALNAAYTDSGLFGVILSIDGRQAGKAVEAATKVFKSGSVSSDDVARGKAQLKAAILCNNGTDAGRLADLGVQALLVGNIQSTDDLVAAVDAVTPADVSAALSKASSNLSMGAVGNLAYVPYRCDLS